MKNSISALLRDSNDKILIWINCYFRLAALRSKVKKKTKLNGRDFVMRIFSRAGLAAGVSLLPY